MPTLLQTTPPQEASGADRLDALTGLRFLAAAAVYISHIRVWFRLLDFHTGPLGSAAVGFFFTLSGFILSHVYRSKTTSKATFYKARLARIWPLHIVCIAIVMMTPGLAGLPQDAAGWAQLASHLTLTQAWTLDIHWALNWNGPSWSLSVEAFFYLLFPLTLALSSRTLVWLYALTLLATLIVYANADDLAAGDAKASDAWATALSTLPPMRLQEFLAGICVHLAWVRRPQFFRIAPTSVSTALELLSISLVVACFLAWGSGQWGQAWMSWLNLPIAVEGLSRGPGLSWAFALLIFVFASGQGLLGKVLSHPWAVYLGEISFAFYLVHAAVMNMAAAWAGEFLGAWQRPCLVSILWSIGASALLFAFVETPMRKAIMERSQDLAMRWRTARSSAAAELRRTPARLALGIGCIGCAVAAFAPLTARDHCLAAVRGSDPRLLRKPITEDCMLLGATTRLLSDSLECTAATKGAPPEGTEIHLLALTKDGSLVCRLDCSAQTFVEEGDSQATLLTAKTLLPTLAGASLLELRVVRAGDMSHAPIAGSEPVELLRLPY